MCASYNASEKQIPPEGFRLLPDEPIVKKQVFIISAGLSSVADLSRVADLTEVLVKN